MSFMAYGMLKSNSRKKLLLCHLGALLVVTMWGGSFVSTKVLINNHLGPVEIYIYRFVMAYLLVLAMCHKKILANNWRDEFLFLVCGLCGSSIYFIAENNAVNYTRVSDVSMITTLSPLLTTLLIGALYKNERPGRWTYISSIIAFLGVGCIIFKDGFTSMADASGPDALSTAIGDLLALGAAFSWAIYAVVLRKLCTVCHPQDFFLWPGDGSAVLGDFGRTGFSVIAAYVGRGYRQSAVPWIVLLNDSVYNLVGGDESVRSHNG